MNAAGIMDFDIADDDDVEVIDLVENGVPRRLYERTNYFETLDASTFRKRFRLSKECTLYVLTLIEEQLEYPYDINNSVSPMNQLLTCMRLFSTGGHLDMIGDYMGMHLSTVSRIVVKVSEALAALYNQFIGIPNDRESLRKIQQDFYDVFQFPRVVGAIDCTHIRIQSPGGEDAEIYRNRKSYFSLNTQMVCDAHLKVMNVVARWPGSAHDSTIFTHSRIKQNFDNGIPRNCLLLGDSGYPNKTYLFTPLLQPNTVADQRYNEAHIRTRNVIERCFGVIKRRFPILAYGCRLKVQTVQAIIIAATVLHNIALQMGDVEPPPLPEELDEHELNFLIEQGQIPEIPMHHNNHLVNENLTRRQFINQFFATL